MKGAGADYRIHICCVLGHVVVSSGQVPPLLYIHFTSQEASVASLQTAALQTLLAAQIGHLSRA